MEKYFDEKVEKILEINMDSILDPFISREEVKKKIVIILKEISRDQRYACIDAILEYANDKSEIDNIQAVIHNANIKIKEA